MIEEVPPTENCRAPRVSTAPRPFLSVQTFNPSSTCSMNVPSFTSFPSFDTEPGPSKPRLKSPSRSKSETDRHHKHKKDKDKKDKSKRDKKVHSADHSIHDDERLKAEEDRKRTDEKPVYFSDRKGDNLNVRYGGLHAGDVPKYRLYAGAHAAS